MKMTRAKLIELAKTLKAIELKDESVIERLTSIAYSLGRNGVNAELYRSNEDRSKFYYIPNRSSLLYYYG